MSSGQTSCVIDSQRHHCYDAGPGECKKHSDRNKDALHSVKSIYSVNEDDLKKPDFESSWNAISVDVEVLSRKKYQSTSGYIWPRCLCPIASLDQFKASIQIMSSSQLDRNKCAESDQFVAGWDLQLRK